MTTLIFNAVLHENEQAKTDLGLANTKLSTEIRIQTTNNVVQYLDHNLSAPVLINRINADAFC
ncbi:hypothetical protein [Trichormus azollae]|jgi:hypothetical protein|uniref:Uncharacterized protein n=1 Tax=Nostoc azollae (strain 0708) TaxID=551115 RepID=D7E3H2_NOSA0|nr:hypothetical protein [Trichormus azollae]ADI65141.1 hypothetical protein Aazo_3540 ['Nostoc azollae' 0708]